MKVNLILSHNIKSWFHSSSPSQHELPLCPHQESCRDHWEHQRSQWSHICPYACSVHAWRNHIHQVFCVKRELIFQWQISSACGNHSRLTFTRATVSLHSSECSLTCSWLDGVQDWHRVLVVRVQLWLMLSLIGIWEWVCGCSPC